MLCRLLLAVLLGAAVELGAEPAAPPPGRPVLEADKFEADTAGNVLVFTGNARLRDDNALLLADEIRYEQDTGRTTAIGQVVFTRGAMRLLADRIVYQRSDGSFTAEQVRLGQHPYFAEGEFATGTRTEVTVRRARATYGEPGPWQPTITAQTLTFSENQQIRSEDVAVGIGHTQPVPIPRFNYSLSAPLAGAVSLDGGFRRSLGAFALATLHVPVLPSLRVGPELGLYSDRGIMIGPAARYSDIGDGRWRGELRSGYINDHGEKGTDRIGRRVPESRAYLEWGHEQVLAPHLTLRAQLNWWQDSEVVRDFRPRAFFPVQEPDTFIETVYRAPNSIVSAFARLEPNDFQVVQERLPEIRFDLLPLSLGRGFYHRFHAGAAVLREDPLPLPATSLALRAPKLASNRLDAYYGLERPITPRDWLAITPVLGGRLTHYASPQGTTRAGDYTRILGEAGLDAALRASGTFDYQNPRWKIDGLRHLVTPRISYRYRPESDRGDGRIPRIDRESFSTYLQPLGLGEARHVDDLRALNTLRVGLDNLLQTRDPAANTRDLLAFNVANDFRFKRRPGERDVSEIHTELSLTPAPWLQVDVYDSFTANTQRLREFNSAVTIRDGRLWELRLTNNFLRAQIEDYAIAGRWRLNEAYEATTRLHYDARRRRFNEQSYGITQNLGNTWLISYNVSIYSGRRRESSFGFNIRVDTIRF